MSKLIDDINQSLSDLNETKDRYAFVGYNSDNKTDYLETTLEDIEDIIDACYEAKTLIKKQLKLKKEGKK